MWRNQRLTSSKRYHSYAGASVTVSRFAHRSRTLQMLVQVGRSVQKKRANKANAVEQLSKSTITFSNAISSFSDKVTHQDGKKEVRAASNTCVALTQETEADGSSQKPQVDHPPGESPTPGGKKVLCLRC
jgi:hypothetical protein